MSCNAITAYHQVSIYTFLYVVIQTKGQDHNIACLLQKSFPGYPTQPGCVLLSPLLQGLISSSPPVTWQDTNPAPVHRYSSAEPSLSCCRCLAVGMHLEARLTNMAFFCGA